MPLPLGSDILSAPTGMTIVVASEPRQLLQFLHAAVDVRALDLRGAVQPKAFAAELNLASSAVETGRPRVKKRPDTSRRP